MVNRHSGILFLLSLILISLLGCRTADPSEPPEFILTGELIVDGPESVSVGQAVEIIVEDTSASAPDGTPVFLSLMGSYGANMLRAEFENNKAWFYVPPELTTRSGATTLIATSGEAGGKAQLIFRPDEPVEPITPLVGSRSIIADADHWAMAVVIPFDRFGNPIATGTPVDIRSLHPGNNLRTYRPETEHLLVWERIYSGTKAGRTVIAANIEDVHGPEGILLEIPGWPVPYTLSADPPNLPADRFQLVTLRSSIIVDQYDNMMPDGTQVSFVVTGPTGETRILPTITIDGIAETIMQAPRTAGAYTIHGVTFGIESEPLILTFSEGPAIEPFPVKITIDNLDRELDILAGPITADLDQYVPDGTQVSFTINAPDGTSIEQTAQSDAGYATLPLRLAKLAAGRYTVTVMAGSGTGTTHFIVPE